MGNANNALRLLRQILNFALASACIESNPTRGIQRNRRPALTRFLSREEIARLLGNADVSMTLRYAHLGDRDIEASAERVGQAVAEIMGR